MLFCALVLHKLNGLDLSSPNVTNGKIGKKCLYTSRRLKVALIEMAQTLYGIFLWLASHKNQHTHIQYGNKFVEMQPP